MKNNWNHLHPISNGPYVAYSDCQATFGNFSPEENGRNQLNNWEKYPWVDKLY